MKPLMAAVLVAWGLTGPVGAESLSSFEFEVPADVPQSRTCAFSALTLPAQFKVYAAGSYSGRDLDFQIDQSGHTATQFDVAVNSPDQPTVLILGAYEPTIWNIGWSEGTEIIAVMVSGYHRQAVAGLPDRVPVLNSSYANRGPCGYFYVGEKHYGKLNPLARRLFDRPVDMIYPPVANGKIVVGAPLGSQTRLVTSQATRAESFKDPKAPLAGPAGLEEALRQGILRSAGQADADAWVAQIAAKTSNRDVPPIVGGEKPKPPQPMLHNAYVVLKPFTYPAGLYGAHSATFFVAKGVPLPRGNRGHSTVYDFNSGSCLGGTCGMGR